MNRFIKKWPWASACAAALLIVACNDDKTDGEDSALVPPIVELAGVPAAGFHFLYYDIGPQTFTMTADAPWEITKTAGWFVVTPKQGKAGETIKITITGDFNGGDARIGEFTVTANSGNNLKPCLTQKTVSLSQDAHLSAGIVITGLSGRTLIFGAEDSQPVTFKVNASYDWTLDIDDESWVTVSPKHGAAGAETQVTVTPTPNMVAERHESTITITAGDPDFSENTETETIELVQSPYWPMDSHAVGHVFLSDDFSWVTTNWVSPYTRYGWPSVMIDGVNYNEFTLSNAGIAPIAAAKGYTYDYAYARYEGVVKFGNASTTGWISTPVLSGIDAGKAAALLVQFDAALYSSAGGTVDGGDDKMYVSVSGPGTVGGLVETEAGVQITNVWSWRRYSVVVYGATNETSVKFGKGRTLSNARLYLDNISITRADEDDPGVPPPADVETPLDREFIDNSAAELFDGDNQVVGEGGTLTYSVRVNKEWSAETDVDWLTITSVRCGDKAADAPGATGANNGASLAAGAATVRGTGLPYNNTKIVVSPNGDGAVRTGSIIIKSGGVEIERIQVTQAIGRVLVITGLTDNRAEISDDPASAAATVKFMVNAPYDWEISVPGTDSWYEVTPQTGSAAAAVEVTIKAMEANTGTRRFGVFTIESAPDTGAPQTTSISVEQLPASTGSVNWDMAQPVQWLFSAADMYKYEQYFIGKASDASANNALPAEQGPGYISYTHTYPGLPDVCDRQVGSTGHPFVAGAWPGDYWLFTVPVASLNAGTKVQFTALTRTSPTGQLYWKMEYNDGGTWKPVIALQTEDVNGADVSFTHKVPSSNITIDVTVTYANSLIDSKIEFRMTCVANWKADGTGALTQPNTGTFRWAGASITDSPRIQIVP